MAETPDVLIAALADFVLDIYAQNIAMLSLLRETPGFHPAILDREMEKAIRRVQRTPGVRDLRTKHDPSKLMEIMATLRTM